jgi:hypothetical protein
MGFDGSSILCWEEITLTIGPMPTAEPIWMPPAL